MPTRDELLAAYNRHRREMSRHFSLATERLDPGTADAMTPEVLARLTELHDAKVTARDAWVRAMEDHWGAT
jgi:hypothetical protein